MEIDKQTSGSPISFRLDPTSGVPTYMQLVRQVEQALTLGYLLPGDQLPKVKDAVESLAINPNTVLKAYRELEHKGLTVGRPGQGTYIKANLDVTPLRDQAALTRRMARWLESAAASGLDAEGMTALFTSALHEHAQKHSSQVAS